MSPQDSRGRRRGVQHVFDVVRREQVSPHLVRLHLGGPAFAAFADGIGEAQAAATDKYVKLLFARPGLGLEPPFDMDALRERLAPEDMPSRRTYTVRSIDAASGTIAIDFVVHGDEGIAGPWAAAAGPGDRVALSGPGGGYAPADDVDAHVLLGDESALPAIAAALESLPADARGLVLLEVAGPEEEVALAKPAGVAVTWIHRGTAAYGALLAAVVENLEVPTGTFDVFAHGEREAMKRLRPLFTGAWGVPRDRLSLSAYWAFGRAEDTFQAEKREPVGQIFEPGPA
ncbi:siderophore-interacting protein [Microbacterium excoecariae]|uniref:siderophore-interacting protein n=1 Tax=Microbacterium excoecariae TaxID=2715210 RepID=UPI001407B946|nr:siderophore-interacting protein [Microbacterium excoecariae]NHI16790.1 siderophore-interacting protein [Microbacterium excoecariae]